MTSQGIIFIASFLFFSASGMLIYTQYFINDSNDLVCKIDNTSLIMGERKIAILSKIISFDLFFSIIPPK